MAANVLGRAYIEVHADTSAFARELERDVALVATAAERQSVSAGERIGRGLNKGMEREVRRGGNRVGGTLYRAVEGGLFRSSRRGRFLSGNLSAFMAREAVEVGARVGTSLAGSFVKNFGQGAINGLQSIFGTLGNITKSIGSSVGNVGSSGPLALGIGIALLVGIPALIGAIIALVSVLGPLLNLLFLIPAALGGILFAILPVVAAFQGFSSAVSAFVSGDAKAIKQATKDMATPAAKVAQEFAKLMPFFKQIQKFSAGAFFTPLVGAFTELQKRIGPTLLNGFTGVAAAAGAFADKLIALAGSAVVKTFLEGLFQFAQGKLFGTLGDSIVNFLRVMAVLGTKSLPSLSKLVDGFSRMIDRFASWIERSIQNGDFDRFMDKMFYALDKVGELIDSSAELIGALIGDEDQQQRARDFFDEVIKTIDDLTTFFRSEDGKLALQGLLEAANTFLIVLKEILIFFLRIVAAVQLFVNLLREALRLTGLLNGASTLRRIDRSPTAGGTQTLGLAGHASGTISTQEHVARISEGGKAEAVIPLTNPDRARELANKSGLTSMMADGLNVTVYIGDEQVMGRVEARVGSALSSFGRSMKYRPRLAGVSG